MSLPKMSVEDRQRVEVATLKITNVRLQLELLKVSVDKATSELQSFTKEMGDLRDELNKKYEVDFERVRIMPDGQLVEAK